MSNLIFTLNIVAPVFLIIFIGFFLKRIKIIDETFNSITSKVVFNVAMPALLFQKLSSIPVSEVFDLFYLIYVVAALCFMFVFAWIVSTFFTHDGRNKGAFIQGAFRGNFAIIGFALIFNAYSEDALAPAAIVLAVIMPLYNILSIIALTVPVHKEQSIHPFVTLIKIITNPLILAAFFALPFSILNIPIHSIFTRTVDYLAALTLPLALIGIGSSLGLKSARERILLAFGATSIKIVIMPIFCTFFAILLGFRGQELGILFFLFAAPTAIASYIMAEALGSNSKLAANIVMISTFASLVTISVGIFILRSLHLF